MINTVDREILRFHGDEGEKLTDRLVVEKPVTLFLNGEQFVTLLCTPEHLDCLAVGFLRSEGLLEEKGDLVRVDVDREQGFVFVDTVEKKQTLKRLYGKRTITSGCGKGTIFFNVLDSRKSRVVDLPLEIFPDQLAGLVKELQEQGKLFRETGGNHSAALCTAQEIVVLREDIGRHNAVDKVVGLCLLEGIAVEGKLMVTTGRLSSEILLKVAKLGIPLLVSRAAPTSLSVELAAELGITLVGFVRGRRMNVYTHPWRIKRP